MFTNSNEWYSHVFKSASKAVMGIALVAAISLGQTLDTGILGTVTDPNGAVIPGASVTISEAATGFVRKVTTSAEGGYEVRYLRPGNYTVQVGAAGFRTERHTGIDLQISQLARIDIALQVGEVMAVKSPAIIAAVGMKDRVSAGS